MTVQRGASDRDSNRPGYEELLDVVGRLDLGLVVIDLNDFTILAASRAAVKSFGLGSEAVPIGRPALDLLTGEDRTDAQIGLDALRSGAIDFYRTHLHKTATEGKERRLRLGARAFTIGERRLALISAALDNDPAWGALSKYLGGEPVDMAFGTVDGSWTITAISSDVVALLGVGSTELVGQPLLARETRDAITHLLDGGHGGHDFSFAVPVSLPAEPGNERQLSAVVTSLVGVSGRYFVLVPSRPPAGRAQADRSAELEQHLWRIAAEVEASGVLQTFGQLPDVARHSQLGTLSTRQWEVLSHLMRGERVSAIADALYLSPSTVRNHLAAIFERFGVHSQAELLALLARPDNPHAKT